MSISFKVEGLKEMERALAQLPRTTSKSVARRALRNQLKPVAAMANAFWPGSDDNVFRIASRLSRGQRSGRAGPSEVRLYVGAAGGAQGTPEAHLIEFGTGPRYHQSGKYVGQVAPTPMLQPAWEMHKGNILRGLAAELRAEMEKTMARQAKRGR